MVAQAKLEARKTAAERIIFFMNGTSYFFE
jgi:hypothetical protein